MAIRGLSRRLLPMLTIVCLAVSACGDPAADLGTTTTTSLVETTTSGPTPTSTTSSTVPVADPGALLVIGDWGSGTLPQGAVAGAMSRFADENPVAAILTTGDNFSSDDYQFLTAPYGWAAEADIPFWITWGDTDVVSPERVDAVNQAFGSPPNWAVYEWGSMDVVVLDSTQPDSLEQVEFVESLGDGFDDPRIVVVHHPPYSCNSDQDPKDSTAQWAGTLGDETLLVISGHDNNYQRFEVDGATFVVTGGGGSPIKELGECPNDQPVPMAEQALHHFVALAQHDGLLVATVFDVSGAPVDSFEIELP